MEKRDFLIYLLKNADKADNISKNEDEHYQFVADFILANDVAPVALGNWEYIRTQNNFAIIKCSRCGQETYASARFVTEGMYCPYCGAKMTCNDNELQRIQKSERIAHWVDDADCWYCSKCGYESNNPNKEKYGAKMCPKCGANIEF